MTQERLGAKHQGHIAHPAVRMSSSCNPCWMPKRTLLFLKQARTSSEDLLVSVRHMLATELNIAL